MRPLEATVRIHQVLHKTLKKTQVDKGRWPWHGKT
jgi:hypothetical protein